MSGDGRAADPPTRKAPTAARSHGRPSDDRLVRRAAIVVAAQTAAAVAVVVAAVALLVLALTVREQHADAERMVRGAATSAQDVVDPPLGVVLLIRGVNGQVAASPGAPKALANLNIDRLPPGRGEVVVGPGSGTRYEIYTLDKGRQRVVAALDSRFRASETDRLVAALLPAGAVGIAAAALIGWLIGRRAVRPLGSALALQRRFVADASHELRTPLTILHTRAQMLNRRAGTDVRLRRDLDRLIADTRTLSEIVNDLLLSAEMEHRSDTREPVDLVDVAREVADGFAPAAEQAGVSITVEAEPDEAAVVAGVRAALRRAINSLVDNALGHTHAGDLVTLRVAHPGNTVTLAVVDNGDGLDPAQAAALTERFARGEQAPGHGRRFGLGLALVREVVHAHGGTLTLDGRLGQGTTATITIPRTTSAPLASR
jgi:signal transduction histidine kinase